jgi:hypothetical protein
VSPLTVPGENDSPNLFGQVVERSLIEHDILARNPDDRIPAMAHRRAKASRPFEVWPGFGQSFLT